MNAAEIKAAYARELKEPIKVRRFTGAGPNRPFFDIEVRGKARLYGATELIGTITQGDWNVLLLVDDLTEQNFAHPLTTNDKAVVDGKEIAILAASTRKAPDGTKVVYDCQAR